MILQKPKVKKAIPTNAGRPYQASFLPDNKMSEELEQAFHKNNEFRHLMKIPERVISSYIERKANDF
jgi:hypothetical protein